MNLTPYQKKQFNLVLVLLIGIPATIFAIYKGVQYLSMASADPTPKEVVVSNVATNSLTISWITEKSVEGYVIPVISGNEQSPVEDKRGSGSRFTHYVEIKGLEPSTEYSFILLSEGERYTSSSEGTYIFSTAPVGTETPVPNPIHGTVTGISGDDVIVYAMFSNKSVYPVSTIVPSSGNWIVDLSSFRKVDDMSMVRTTNETEMVIMAKAGTEKGTVLEGVFSTLFDSNGKLNQTLAFEIAEISNLISYYPSDSLLGTKSTIEEEEEDTEPIIPTPPIVDDEIEEETGPYSIRHDVPWKDLIGSGNVSLESGVSTILVTNVTDVGFTVVWRSSSPEQGFVKYGTDKDNLDKEIRDIRDGLVSMSEYTTHFVESDRLEPQTTYYFEVHSGNSIYNNGGQKYPVKTYPTLSTPPPFETRSGQILGATDPSEWIVIFKIIDNDELGSSGSSGYLATLPDSNGNWILTVGDARNESGTTYFSFSNSDILQAYFLGADYKKFDTTLAPNDIELNVTDIGTNTSGSVSLLSSYGIINL